MNRFKMIFGYVLGFICSCLLTLLAILVVFKINVFNQDYILSALDKNNYYKDVYDESLKDAKNSLLSSGLDESVLEGLYSSADVERDIKNYIASIYSGSKAKIETDTIKNRLNNNIDKYLKDKNLEVTDGKSLDAYIDGILKIYDDSIDFYGYFDDYIISFVGLCKYIDLFIGILAIVVSCLYVVLRYYLHKKYLGVMFLSAGFMLLYWRYFIYSGIDFKNITIISDSFSNVIRDVLADVGSNITIIAILFIIISVLLNIMSSMMKVKRIKR